MKTLLKFEADWCGPCKMMTPLLNKLQSELPNISILYINIDDPINQDTVRLHNVRSVPTIIILDENGNFESRLVGVVSYNVLKDAVYAGLLSSN